jgi:hypothetical protein
MIPYRVLMTTLVESKTRYWLYAGPFLTNFPFQTVRAVFRHGLAMIFSVWLATDIALCQSIGAGPSREADPKVYRDVSPAVARGRDCQRRRL